MIGLTHLLITLWLFLVGPLGSFPNLAIDSAAVNAMLESL